MRAHAQGIGWLVVLALSSCAIPESGSKREDSGSDRPPNIVLIVADDLGYGDLSAYGQTRWKTPHLDQMARDGALFTQFYVTQSVCSASRAAILTGCYSNRVGIGGALGPDAKAGLNLDELTIAELCRAQGYSTAAFGKWHLGSQPSLFPTHHGFGEWSGISCSNDMWPRHPDFVDLPPDTAARKRGYPPLVLYEGERPVNPGIEPDDQRQFTRHFTERACRFIQANAERPFFLYLAHPMPHVPLFCSPEFEGRSGAGLYGDVIAELDWSVGQILAQLELLELAEQTLVIFVSDNGPWLSYGDHAGTTAGLREGKGTSFEGGVRVPCVMQWKGRIPAGRRLTTPAMTIDFLPTIAEWVRAAGPEKPIDGRSLGRLVMDGEDEALRERPLAFYYNQNDLEAVRQGRWKLILPHRYRTLPGPAGKGGSPGPYRNLDSGLALYDLEADPAESTDLAAQEPEVLARLLAAAEQFRADLGDDLTKRVGSGRRPPGRAP